MSRVLVIFVFGAVLGGACADREPAQAEPDREALCATHCEQVFSSCNPDPPANWEGPASESECYANCVDDSAWTGPCRFKHADFLTCTTTLSCSEFSEHQSDNLGSPCADDASAWSSCVP